MRERERDLTGKVKERKRKEREEEEEKKKLGGGGLGGLRPAAAAAAAAWPLALARAGRPPCFGSPRERERV